MRHRVTATIAMAALSGCATVMNDATPPIRGDTKTADGQVVSGADCAISNDNDKDRVTVKSGQTA
ncbi:Putative secreted protein (fragment) [Xanthomonas citri pv. fuscans]|uniref:Secreted protein n=1 Tax=Xanthomonas campestris pv. phaseoli TaxID=317013 RepID=A0A7Z7NH12_XANCH